MLGIDLGSIREYLSQLSRKDEESSFVRTYSGRETLVAAASYIPFFSALILVLRSENSEFVSFHARQALVVTLLAILLLMLAPGFFKLLIAILACTLFIFGTYRALQGRKWYLPGVTDLANTFEI